jgi:hypothetical protein
MGSPRAAFGNIRAVYWQFAGKIWASLRQLTGSRMAGFGQHLAASWQPHRQYIHCFYWVFSCPRRFPEFEPSQARQENVAEIHIAIISVFVNPASCAAGNDYSLGPILKRL